MREILPEIEAWRARGDEVAVALVVETWGSAPRGVGAAMAVSSSGVVAGSVSGGCVESSVVEAARKVLADGKPLLLHFGVADETAWAVGLSCGGGIDVFVFEPGDNLIHEVRDAIVADRPFVVAVVTQGPDALVAKAAVFGGRGEAGALGGGLDEETASATERALAQGRSQRLGVGTAKLLLAVEAAATRLVIVGGVHIAQALSGLAGDLGYRTTIVDPREGFANATRFPRVDRVLKSWPDDALREIGMTPWTAVAVLTHDPKLDDPALLLALPSDAFYVGALGGRATQEKRRKRLLEAGLAERHLDRLHAPIGLDLGGRSPEEIALSVIAEVVAARNGRPSRHG